MVVHDGDVGHPSLVVVEGLALFLLEVPILDQTVLRTCQQIVTGNIYSSYAATVTNKIQIYRFHL